MALWRINREEGTAAGPSAIIETNDGIIQAQALWSDKEGTGIALEVPMGIFLTAVEVEMFINSLQNLIGVAAPTINL